MAKLHGLEDVTTTGGMLVRELFFHWEENERVAFYVVERVGPNSVTKFVMKPFFQRWWRRYEAILEARAASRSEESAQMTAAAP